MIAQASVRDIVRAPEATYGFTGRDGPSIDDLTLTAVTAHGWRISDERLPQGDPLRLVAFVERRGDVFEVMQIGAGFQWHEFESIDAALAFVVESAPRVAQQRLQGELSWLR